MTLGTGNLLYNRYRVVEILGRGGMGAVYRATDESLGVDVAVKENLFTTDDYARQFRMEAVILAGIRHPNLPRVSDHFVIDDLGQYLVMDYIEGDDLRQIMEKHGPISEQEAIHIGAAACDALAYLHTRKPPILHRDIKLGNIKITPDGQVYLVDFGLAKMGWEHEETMTGARAMTPGYSPPEQYGSARTDARSDIYSLGATLYAALAGMIPEDSLARAVDGLSLTPLRNHRPDISTRLASVIEKALATASASRYQTADAFKAALLGDSLADQVTQVPADLPPVSTTSAVSITAKPIRRTSSIRLPISLILLLMLVSAIAILVNSSNRRLILSKILPAPIVNPLPTKTSLPAPSPTNLPPATFTSQPKPSATLIPTKIPTSQPSSTSSPAATATAQSTATSKPTNTELPASPVPVVLATPQGGGTGQIAFASVVNKAAQIFLVNADGTGLRALTSNPKGACSFDWSPNGQQIVFVSPCADKSSMYLSSGLYLLDIENGAITPLPFTAKGDFEPAWSPDGEKIAFTSNRDGSMQIYVFTLADSNLTRITAPDNNPQSRYPAWSPDSSQIVYTVLRIGLLQIWSMSADGSNKKQLLRTGSTLSDYAPAWSPDGASLLYSETNRELNAPSSLFQYDFSTGKIAKLALPQPVVDADFSPDGRWITYESTDSINQDIFLAEFPNGAAQRLTTSSQVDFDPAWRPGK
jgi:serine/threonine protein kinase/Tol biopolymer transport system component